jgi:hypothetical protein
MHRGCNQTWRHSGLTDSSNTNSWDIGHKDQGAVKTQLQPSRLKHDLLTSLIGVG